MKMILRKIWIYNFFPDWAILFPLSTIFGFSQYGWKIAQVRWSEFIAEIWFFLKYFESRTFFLSSVLSTISNVKNNISPFLIWQSISVNHCVCTKGHSQFHSIFIFAKFSVFSYFLSKVNQIILLGIFHFFSSKISTLRFFLQKCLQKCYNDWIQRRFNLKHQWIQIQLLVSLMHCSIMYLILTDFKI